MSRALVLCCVLSALPAPLPAQRYAIELIGVGELWKTDGGSRLLARNGGEVSPEATLYTLLTLRASPTLELFFMDELSYAERELGHELELAELRWRARPELVLNAGRVLLPIGIFGQRHLPPVNPLIGDPDLYPPLYPWGAIASGSIGWFDYRAGILSLPAVNERYSPAPSHRPRPAMGAGLTLSPALRVGLSATHGPYLGESVASMLPAGSAWHDFAQTVIAGDVRFGVGYLDMRAEAAWSSYEVPTHSERVNGIGAYIEAKVTIAPRLFAAARVEHFDYAFIQPVSPAFWVGTQTLQRNAEIGLGFLPGRRSMIKLSYRRDQWPGEPAPGAPAMPNGYAVAVQGVIRVGY